MVEVKFYDYVDDSLLKFAVIIAKTDGKWVFCKHKDRETFEVPGGHRESGEDILDTIIPIVVIPFAIVTVIYAIVSYIKIG